MLARKVKTKIGEDRMLVVHIPDIPPGEVEIIILKEDERAARECDPVASIPRRRVGKIMSKLRREDIYSDAR
jgi:hypothetical protein